MKFTQGSSFLERQSGSRRKENTAAVDSIMKEERNEHQAPKQTWRSQITGHPAPHLECCGHHRPLLSQTHPGAPDSAQAGPPPAHPPSATGKQKERGTHVTKQFQNTPTFPCFLLTCMNKRTNRPPMLYSVLSRPITSLSLEVTSRQRKGRLRYP